MRLKNTGNGLAILTAISLAGAAVAAEDQVIDPALFSADAMVKPYETVDCTLSDGTATQCVQFVVRYLPEGMTTGPFCSETVDELGGVWLWDGEQPGLYNLNKAFWELMASLGFDFTDDDGNINITDPAGPPPDSSKNYCLEATADDTVEATIQIPLVPSASGDPSYYGTVSLVGLALDGIPIFADAPSVADTGHLPALDPCGGHFDPGGYYHWHEIASDVATLDSEHGLEPRCHLAQSTSALFGFAYDGYPIYGSTDEDGVTPGDLDECNGHVGATKEYPDGVYHYHADDEGHNLPACLRGAVSDDAFQTNAGTGLGSTNVPGGGRAPPRQ